MPIDAAIAARRPDRAGRAERGGQDDAPPAGGRPRRARPRRGPSQARPDPRAARPGGPFRRGVHGLAGPAAGGPDRRRASRPDGRATGRDGARGHRHRPRLRRAPAPVRDPRRLHPRPARRERADRARVHAARSGPSRRRRCRAASRRGRRWRGSSSPTRTCCCSTNRRTTSTSTRSNGSRSTSAGGTARCWSRRTTGPSSTRP